LYLQRKKKVIFVFNNRDKKCSFFW